MLKGLYLRGKNPEYFEIIFKTGESIDELFFVVSYIYLLGDSNNLGKLYSHRNLRVLLLRVSENSCYMHN